MKSIIFNVLTGLLLFFAPINGLLVAVGAAIFLDTFTGVIKSIKNKGLSSIRSRIMSNTISKMLLYEMCVIMLYPIDYFLLNELVFNLVSIEYFSTKLTCVVLIFVEGVSIKENIEETLNIKIWNLLKNAINRAKEVKDDISSLQE